MSEKKIAKANWMAEKCYGLKSNVEYILERTHYGNWSVYDFNGNYITECRTDAFDNFRNFEEWFDIDAFSSNMKFDNRKSKTK